MNLHLTKIGNEKNPRIIFLHGLFGQGEDFLYFANQLADKYYSILVDLPGHGQSEIFEEKSFSKLCQFVLKSLPSANQKSMLIGYSLGGRIALYLLTQCPQFFSKGVIISANPGLEAGKEERLKNDLSLLDNIFSPEDFFKNWYSKPLFGDLVNHKNFPYLMEKRKKVKLLEIKKCLGAFSVGVQPSLWKNLKENSLPVFYFCGKKDEKFHQIGQIISQYPSINLIEFKNAGHFLHFEYPTPFIGHLSSILSQ